MRGGEGGRRLRARQSAGDGREERDGRQREPAPPDWGH